MYWQRNRGLIPYLLLVAVVIPALCWAAVTLQQLRVPDPPAGQVLLLAWQEFVIKGLDGDTVQRTASRRADFAEWTEDGAVGDVLQIQPQVVQWDQRAEVWSIATIGPGLASVWSLRCAPEVVYGTGSTPTRELVLEGLRMQRQPLPETPGLQLARRFWSIDAVRCNSELKEGSFALFQVNQRADLNARIAGLDGRSDAAFGADFRKRQRVLNLAEHVQAQTAERETWAYAALWAVLGTGWVAMWVLLLLRQMQLRPEQAIRIQLGASARRLWLWWMRMPLAGIGLGVGLAFALAAMLQVDLLHPQALPWAGLWLLGASASVMAVAYGSVRQRHARAHEARHAQSLTHTLPLRAMTVLWTLMLFLVMVLAAPFTVVRDQLAAWAATDVGYQAEGLWTWKIRLPQSPSVPFDPAAFAAQLQALADRHPQITHLSFADTGPWSYQGFDGVSGAFAVGLIVGPAFMRTLDLNTRSGADFEAQDIGRGVVATQGVTAIQQRMFHRGKTVIGEFRGVQMGAWPGGPPQKISLELVGAQPLTGLEVIARIAPGRAVPLLDTELAALLPPGSALASARSVPGILAAAQRPLHQLAQFSGVLLLAGLATVVLLGGSVILATARLQRRPWGIRLTLGAPVLRLTGDWGRRYALSAVAATALGVLVGEGLIRAMHAWVPGLTTPAWAGTAPAMGLLGGTLLCAMLLMYLQIRRTPLAALLRAEG